MAGNTDSYGAGSFDVYLIKTDANGNWIEEGTKRTVQTAGIGLRALPNPFTAFTRIQGHEDDDFVLSDVTGRSVGMYKGAKIGENLSAGVYFIIPHDQGIDPLRILKIK